MENDHSKNAITAKGILAAGMALAPYLFGAVVVLPLGLYLIWGLSRLLLFPTSLLCKASLSCTEEIVLNQKLSVPEYSALFLFPVAFILLLLSTYRLLKRDYYRGGKQIVDIDHSTDEYFSLDFQFERPTQFIYSYKLKKQYYGLAHYLGFKQDPDIEKFMKQHII